MLKIEEEIFVKTVRFGLARLIIKLPIVVERSTTRTFLENNEKYSSKDKVLLQ